MKYLEITQDRLDLRVIPLKKQEFITRHTLSITTFAYVEKLNSNKDINSNSSLPNRIRPIQNLPLDCLQRDKNVSLQGAVFQNPSKSK